MKKLFYVKKNKYKYLLIFLLSFFSKTIVADCPDSTQTEQCCFEINTTIQEQNKILLQFLNKKDTCCTQTIIIDKPCRDGLSDCKPNSSNSLWDLLKELFILFCKIALFPFLLAWATKKWLKDKAAVNYLTLFVIYYICLVVWTLVNNIHINYSISAIKNGDLISGIAWWPYFADIITALVTVAIAIIAWVQLTKIISSNRLVATTNRLTASMENYKLITDGLNRLRQDNYNIVDIENSIKEAAKKNIIAEHPYNKATCLLFEFENLFDFAQKNVDYKKELIENIQYLYRVLYRDRLIEINEKSLPLQSKTTGFGLTVLMDFLFTFKKVDDKLGIHH